MTTPRRILLATDLSCRSDRALDRTVALAREWKARLIIIHVLEAAGLVSHAPSWRRPLDPRRAAEQRVRADVGDASAVDLDLDVIVERGEVATVVLDAAESQDCELIVTGVARDETLGRMLLGRTVETVVRRSKVPVLVVKSRPRGPYRRVMVASDFSESSRTALTTALTMFPDANVSLFHSYDVPYESFFPDKMVAREALEESARVEAEAFLASMPITSQKDIPIVCEYGSPVALLRDHFQDLSVDLVVAGTSGRGRVAELFLGSVAQSLLGSVPGDIMIVPRAQ